MQKHVKSSDAVGRWGGEEFVISLPGADSSQVQQVALRIRDSMAALRVEDADRTSIPAPTVSQGYAIFPDEAVDISALIHLADKRLFRAKARGRNQVEPSPSGTSV
jgi:diguanylate cyclase (GGDEF)-like protein